MRLPMLNDIPSSRQMVDVFGGYNHNLRIADGEFYDMTNMTAEHYPVLAPRKQRGTYVETSEEDGITTTPTAQALISKDALCYVDGKDFVVNGYRLPMGLDTSEKGYPKRLVSMGAYVIILPDKKYVNTANLEDRGDIEAGVETEDSVTFTLCMQDGEEYDNVTVSQTAPEEPVSGQFWMDTSSTPHALKVWSTSAGMWSSVGTTYIKISSAKIGVNFEKYDGVTISGLAGGDLVDPDGNEVSDPNLSALDGSFVVWGKGDNYIVVVGLLDVKRTIANQVIIRRELPDMDFVIESQNRLWGCKYGRSANGTTVNEIYASKLGDFKNWNCFMGISTDSYVASVGTDGKFTGAITHLGYPIFFKENCLHKVYGSYPANYQIQTTACRGVQDGCDRSLAIVNEVLYYKSRGAVCAYDGSLPQEMSQQFGAETYYDAVAGGHGNLYCVSMRDKAGKYSLFVYDTHRDMWHREDQTQADAFCSCRGEMYYIDHATGHIKTMGGTGRKDTAPVEWAAETGILTTSMPDKKYLGRMTIRMSLGIGTRVHLYVEYDSSGAWQHLFTMTGRSLRSFSVPVRPERCDHLRLRFEGEGDAKIFSIAKNIEQGSDL